MCCLFVYLHFMDCLHVLLVALRLSLRFVPANHRQLNFPSSVLKSLEKVVVYKAAPGKEQNSCKPTASDWSWVLLNIRPALRLEVGPLRKTRGILQYKILPGGSPFTLLLEINEIYFFTEMGSALSTLFLSRKP